jgi:hypothetical protein
MFRRYLTAFVMFVVMSFAPGLVMEVQCGGTSFGKSSGLGKFGIIVNIHGSVDMKRPNEKAIRLNLDEHMLHLVRDEDKIRTNKGGRVSILSYFGNILYEIQPDSIVKVVGDTIMTLSKGQFERREGLPKSIKLKQTLKTIAAPEHHCLIPLSPVNTSIISTTPTLVWENKCESRENVTLKLLLDKTVIYQAVTGESTYRVPKDLFKYDETYTWFIDDKTNGLTGATFKILSEIESKNILEKKLSYRRNKEDMSEWIVYIFILEDMHLNEMHHNEIVRLRNKLPNNPNIIIIGEPSTEKVPEPTGEMGTDSPEPTGEMGTDSPGE